MAFENSSVLMRERMHLRLSDYVGYIQLFILPKLTKCIEKKALTIFTHDNIFFSSVLNADILVVLMNNKNN